MGGRKTKTLCISSQLWSFPCPRVTSTGLRLDKSLRLTRESSLRISKDMKSSEDVTYIFKDFIYLFLKRGEGREKKGNSNVWLPFTHPLLGTWPLQHSAVSWLGIWTGYPLVCRQALNPLSHTNQGRRHYCIKNYEYFQSFFLCKVNWTDTYLVLRGPLLGSLVERVVLVIMKEGGG